MTCGPVF